MSRGLWIFLAILAIVLFLFGAIVLSIHYFGKKLMHKGWVITGWITLVAGFVLLIPSLYFSLKKPVVVTEEITEVVTPQRKILSLEQEVPVRGVRKTMTRNSTIRS